jgi:hypothetical protein
MDGHGVKTQHKKRDHNTLTTEAQLSIISRCTGMFTDLSRTFKKNKPRSRFITPYARLVSRSLS